MAEDKKKEKGNVTDFANGFMDGSVQSVAGYLRQLGRIPDAPYATEKNKNHFKDWSVDLYNATLGYPNKTETYEDGIGFGRQVAPVVVGTGFGLGYPGTILANVAANNGISMINGQPYGVGELAQDVISSVLAKGFQDNVINKKVPEVGNTLYPMLREEFKKILEIGKAKANEPEE